MFHRIILFALAAATLDAPQALAEIECLGSTCRLLSNAVAPSRAAWQTVQQLPRDVGSVRPVAMQVVQQSPPVPRLVTPPGEQPRRLAQIVNQEPRDAESDAARTYMRRSPGVHVVAPLPVPIYATPALPPLLPYAATGVVTVPPPSYVDDSVVVPMYPHVRPEPAWQLCQIDGGDRRRDYYYCGPYSYHPYGADGHRPFGTYYPYRRSPGYVLAPDARIVTFQPDD